MIRQLLVEIGLFILPFAGYALYLAANRVGVLQAEAWPLRTVITLLAVAFALLFGSLAALVHFSGAPPGSTYVPAHVENGRLVPGARQ